MRRPFLLLLSLLAIVVPTAIGNATGAVSAASAPAGSGYWMLSSDGHVYAFGGAKTFEAPALGSVLAVDLEPTAPGDGYWVLDQRGEVHTYGAASHFGDLRPTDLIGTEAAASLSATPAGKGYWIFTNRGRAVAFGDAVHHGDMAGTALNGPVLDSIPTPSGQGYYMVASDGGIFSFGDAKFYGSMGDSKLNAPVQSLVPDGDGVGYWLVASDGGIFSFEAPFKGSMGATALNKPVTGMVRYGDGYLMVGEDGGIFNFSALPFSGSLGDRPPAYPIVSVGAFEVPSVQTASNPPGSPSNAGGTESPGSTTTSVNPPLRTTTTTAPPSPPVDDTLLPAGMPSEEPRLVPCETSSRTAKVWLELDGETSSPWAAFNPCDRPLLIAWSFRDQGASGDEGAVVSPGAHFNEPDGPVADHWSARLTTHLVQCWEEGPLPIMLAGAEEWVRPWCDPDDGDTALTGLPPGEPTDVLPCQDGSGEISRAWYYGPDSEEETWGAQNSCEDQWIVIDLPGESASDPYGAALSIAPGAQLHHQAEGFTSDSPDAGSVYLSNEPLDGTGRCPVGYTLYELRPEDDGHFERIGRCPNADDLGWYDEEEPEGDGSLCFGHAPNVIGTEGDDVFPNQDAEEADQPWYIVGLGGNDTLDLGEPDSGTPDVYFCGGDGDDTAIGMFDGFDGGPGEDTAVSYCGGRVESVEHVTPRGCSEDLP